MAVEPCPARSGRGRPRLEVADVFRAGGDAYLARFAPTPEQRRVMVAIEQCRTAALGGHLDVCASCGDQVPAYNSCRNRHCPKCQGLAQARWLAQRRERIIPTKYFHVVFTLPEELRPLARRNPKRIYDLLLESAARTLMEFGKSRLHAQLGITTVLHTWTRDLRFHPHAHCIVTAGGLHEQGDRWVPVRGQFLFPVQLLSTVFRGKLLDGLARLYDCQELDLGGACAHLADPGAFADLKDRLYRKAWVVYAKHPFGGPQQVFEYLGRYTHRVGISNFRLLDFDGSEVRFRTKERKVATLDAVEFIRRFLLHVLPSGFVKIRHYGLVAAANVATKLEIARRYLDDGIDRPAPPCSTSAPTWRDLVFLLTGIDLLVCAICGNRTIERHPLPRPGNALPRPFDTS